MKRRDIAVRMYAAARVVHVLRYREDYNRRRPHQAINFTFPIARNTTDPKPARPTPNAPDCLNRLTRDTVVLTRPGR